MLRHQKSLNVLNDCNQHSSISTIIHEHLWQQFKIYLIVGGLPEVVQNYLENKNNIYTALIQARKKQNEIIYGYYADIAKHSGKINAMHIDRVWYAKKQEKS